MDRLKTLTDITKPPTDFDMSKIEKKFNVEPFTGKEKAVDWLEVFLSECSRFKITDPEQKIKCLKSFMKNGAEDWYRSTKLKLSDDDWTAWSESFLAVFGDKGWSRVRYALAYKYLSGSYSDYALKKERMILEVEKTMTAQTRINLIVVGLPIDVQDKLDKEDITTTDKLFNKLARYENKNEQRNAAPREGKPRVENKVSLPVSERKPCHICESLKLPNRFHAPERCFNKNRLPRERPAPKRTVNLGEGSSSEFDSPNAEFRAENEKNE